MELPPFFETRAHVLVCTGPSCAAQGRALFESTWRAMEERRLAYYADGGSVRLTESGCQGACNHGPNVIAYHAREGGGLDEAWYAGSTPERLIRLVEALHEGDALPERGRYDPGRRRPDGA